MAKSKPKPTQAGGGGRVKAPISQSDTRWVKPKGKPGYVEQISTGKRVTGKVAVVKSTATNRAGSTASYAKGKNKDWGKTPGRGGAGGARPDTSKPRRTTSSPSASSHRETAVTPTDTRTKAQRDNAGVKVGTVRRGTHGVENRWNGKSWVRVTTPGASYQAGAGMTSSKPAAKPAVPAKPAAKPAAKPGVSGSSSGSKDVRYRRNANGTWTTLEIRNGKPVVVGTSTTQPFPSTGGSAGSAKPKDKPKGGRQVPRITVSGPTAK